MAEEPKNRGRPPHQPTDEFRRLVKWAAFKKATHDEISEIIGIARDALRIHYAAELAEERGDMKARLLETGYLKSVGGHVRDWEKADSAMLKFYLERFCDIPAAAATRLQHAGDPDNPLVTKTVVVLPSNGRD